MIENFIEYMWYLLTTPLKKLKKALNKWYVICKVFGRRFDEAKEDILRARDEGMVATCSHEMLPVHAEDRKMARYPGEADENFRIRIANYTEVCRLGGTDQGVILAVKSLGYANVAKMTATEHTGDSGRWAEFYVVIAMSVEDAHPVGFDVVKKQVRSTKEVGAKDNYSMAYHALLDNKNSETAEMSRICLHAKAQFWACHFLDGAWCLDGGVLLNSARKQIEVAVRFDGMAAKHKERAKTHVGFLGLAYHPMEGSLSVRNAAPVNEPMGASCSGCIVRAASPQKELLGTADVTLRRNAWYLDGAYHLGGERLFNAEIEREEL